MEMSIRTLFYHLSEVRQGRKRRREEEQDPTAQANETDRENAG